MKAILLLCFVLIIPYAQLHDEHKGTHELEETDDSDLVRCSEHSSSDWFVVPNLEDFPITDERQIHSGRDPANLTEKEANDRKEDLHTFSHFPFHFGNPRRYWAHGLDDPCDPDIHEKWTTKETINDYYKTDEWWTKICNFPRFLHCNRTKKVCECAPQDVYKVQFLSQKGDSKFPCVADTHQPCFIHVPVGKWPARQQYSFATNVKCARGSKCLRHKHRINGKVADLCGRCDPPPLRRDHADHAHGDHDHDHKHHHNSTSKADSNRAERLVIYFALLFFGLLSFV